MDNRQLTIFDVLGEQDPADVQAFTKKTTDNYEDFVSKFDVRFLKTDPKARYQGYSFFFKEHQNKASIWSKKN